MAKVGFWLKGSKGKLAGAAMQKGADGETIIREIVTPNNPQTEAQMIQRVVMQTVAQAYSKMKGICDHSFEGIKVGQATMAQFMRLNANKLRQKIATETEQGYDLGSIYAFSPLGTKEFAPNEYILSAGSLPEITDLLQDAATYVRLTDLGEYVSGDEITYEQFATCYGLRRGDQVTFLTITGTSQANASFHFARVILDPRDANGEPLPMSSKMFTDDWYEDILNASPRNEGVLKIGSLEGGKVRFAVDSTTLNIIGAAVIVSRKDGENWLRSNSWLYTNPAYTAGFFKSVGECLEAATGVNDVATDNRRYLNNGQANVPVSMGANQYPITVHLGTNPTSPGAELTIIGLNFNNADGYVHAVDANGMQYYMVGSNTRGSNFGKYMKVDGYTSTAPEGATATNTVLFGGDADSTTEEQAEYQTYYAQRGGDLYALVNDLDA